jgi:hypothetical protein
MTTYADEYIEHWGGVFTARDLYHQHGVRFDTFLLAPQEILDSIAQLPPRVAPLLPAQAAAMHRDLEEALVPNGAQMRERGYVQRMRHHAYAVSTLHHNNRRAQV